MTDANIAKSEAKIDVLTSKVGVTEAGNNWVKSALDPFPDQPRDCAGYPDQVNGPSIVQKLKFQKTFSRPADVAAGLWDCHMFFSPWDNDVSLINYDMTEVAGLNGNTAAVYFPTGVIGPSAPNWGSGGNIDYDTAGGISKPCGGLVVRATSSGSNMYTEHNEISIPIPNSYFTNGRTRVIAKGFEVHNTTSDLYKQGSVAVYRDPTVATKPCTIQYGRHFKDMGTGSYTQYPMLCKTTVSNDVPNTVEQVLNILDSREWKAEDGVYVTATLADSVIPPLSEQDSVFPLIYEYGESNTSLKLWYPAMSVVGSSPTFTMAEQNGQYPGYVSCFNLSGAWFTGLSEQTTLTIIVHYIIERFPNETNNDLVVLTTRSPSFDPAAMELYTRTASYLPTGVPVGTNAAGDWIKNVADMLGTLGVPGMPLVRGAVDLWNTLPSLDPNTKVKKRNDQLKKKNNNNSNNNNNGGQGPSRAIYRGPVPRGMNQAAYYNAPPSFRVKGPVSQKKRGTKKKAKAQRALTAGNFNT